jgi:hypothetical protein
LINDDDEEEEDDPGRTLFGKKYYFLELGLCKKSESANYMHKLLDRCFFFSIFFPNNYYHFKVVNLKWYIAYYQNLHLFIASDGSGDEDCVITFFSYFFK